MSLASTEPVRQEKNMDRITPTDPTAPRIMPGPMRGTQV